MRLGEYRGDMFGFYEKTVVAGTELYLARLMGAPTMIPETISSVAASLGFDEALVRECIADLPAEDI